MFTRSGNNVEVALSQPMYELLGFKYEQTKKDWFQVDSLESEDPANLESRLNTFWIYCNIVIPQVIGDQAGKLLRIVPVQGKRGETQRASMYPIQYVNLSSINICNIDFTITTAYGETPIDFKTNTILVLHFRRKL